jgi:hypothetical protein
MLRKLKSLFYDSKKLALFYERKGKYDKAYKEYLNVGNYKKAGGILEKIGRWHEAANIYIKNKEIDLARRAIENCFRKNRHWEKFEIDKKEGKLVTIEEWLKENNQTRRFVRYVQNVDVINDNGVPLIVVLADKLRAIEEFKSAAELYRLGFFLINKNIKNKKLIKNEIWLRYATECYSKVHMYTEAAVCMKDLMMIEVEIGSDISKNIKYNPYRNYTFNLKQARDLNFLPKLIEILEDFDPFNISYDLLKMGESKLSMDLFFKYYAKIARKDLSEKELEIRNEKMSYCLNQYVIYHREKGEYLKAAQIALMNSQKKIAADLFKLAKESQIAQREAKKIPEEPEDEKDQVEMDEDVRSPDSRRSISITKCSVCGEVVEPDWENCPSCKNVLSLNLCPCGEKIKSHWKICPSCGRDLG